MGELKGGRRVVEIFIRRVNYEVYGSNNAIYILCVCWHLLERASCSPQSTPTSLADGPGDYEALAIL